MTDERDNAEVITDLSAGPTQAGVTPARTEGAISGERAPWLAPHRWKPGQSGNPSGRPRDSGSLAAALRRVGVKPAKSRAELAKIARQLGMDLDEVRNIDVVAGLIYEGITQLPIRTVKGSTGAGDKLVGLLQLLFRALDGNERRITLSGPGDLETALGACSGWRPRGDPTRPGVDVLRLGADGPFPGASGAFQGANELFPRVDGLFPEAGGSFEGGDGPLRGVDGSLLGMDGPLRGASDSFARANAPAPPRCDPFFYDSARGRPAERRCLREESYRTP